MEKLGIIVERHVDRQADRLRQPNSLKLRPLCSTIQQKSALLKQMFEETQTCVCTASAQSRDNRNKSESESDRAERFQLEPQCSYAIATKTAVERNHVL
ncbi:hypothetical protein F2P81_009486 [Scophthalmus maximus]|uniref:Uncharacterized protein n=1 Tax=Scophthalmus maximus TaxID=52904 RepID=A0A6A4TA10_SCOMX|nr:hypothetical protein F2P81_009486 [Scophthalmus maximus]